ncbi:single-stranded DNA-binding protein [Burkholderia pseudomallei]|uniref:single-stranded DNA-binding protein n=1 Tax=Burkholderia pseudomallei TaxID=28450 RepID=UPI002949835E|nr:single-stranded DNA-binding protein [Burkholderia pseudomallei]CAJ9609263.1 Single-strand binding protein family [Burkholderia pseudomallei]
MSVQLGEQEMIDALIGGKLAGMAVERSAASGKTFVTAKVRAADSDGEGQFINIVAFDNDVKAALLALSDGDSVSMAGAMKVGTYEARDGKTRININLVASAVLTSYHARRRREAVAEASAPKAGVPRALAAGKRNGPPEARALDRSSAASLQDDDVDF